MAVDIGALRKFADTFGPAIEAIPAVIDAVAKKNDVDRHIELKQVELKKVQDETTRAKEEGEAFVKRMQARGDEIIAEADRYAAEVAARLEREKADAQSAINALKDQAVEAQKAVFAANEKRKEAEAAATTRMAELDAAHNAKVKQLESQIEDLEARHAKAEKSLATLRAKLEV